MRVPLPLVLVLTLSSLSCGHAADAAPGTGCTKASDCSDFDPCTKDVCSAGICRHDQIAGCNSLTRGATTGPKTR